MDTINEHIAARDYIELVNFCEDLELQLALTPNSSITPEDFYGPFLLGYLVQQDLPSARFLWKRLPDNIKGNSKELKAIWDVGVALWQREYENVYSIINSQTWNPTIAPLLEQLSENLRERMFSLISEAYSSIIIDDVIKFVGLSREKVLEVAEERGWDIDLSNNILQPKKTVIDTPQSTSLSNFSQLTDLVIHLEKS
ncbi:2219_t:CDS:2 [Diversispora eburnea]|uniref:COP9 signalosome complex subunit 8 n=1 Tax=Diversispora eburnea TaxID=1213867 RepID=A0A9N8YNY9_9GLOM|nr:2219_t:CDS:2 [Diversispora eburnea]